MGKIKYSIGHFVGEKVKCSYPVTTICGRVIKNNNGRHYPTETKKYITCGSCKTKLEGEKDGRK